MFPPSPFRLVLDLSSPLSRCLSTGPKRSSVGRSSVSAGFEVVRVSGLYAGPLGNWAPSRPLGFPGGRTGFRPRDCALLRPALGRILPALLSPVNGQIEQVVVVVHYLDAACGRPI